MSGQDALCALSLSLSGPAALRVGLRAPALSVSEPGSLCRGPPRSLVFVSGPATRHREPRAPTQRAPGPDATQRPPQGSVSGPSVSSGAVRRYLCRAPALSCVAARRFRQICVPPIQPAEPGCHPSGPAPMRVPPSRPRVRFHASRILLAF